MRLLALVGSLFCGASVAAQRTPPPPAPIEVSIGVVRADGVMLPIATLRNRVWQALSAEAPSRNPIMTPTARAMPLDGWTLFPVVEGDGRAFKLTRRVTVDFQCSPAEVFETTLSTSARLSGIETAKHLGLAVRGNARIQAATDLLAKPDAVGSDVRALITATVNAVEAERFKVTLKYHPDLSRFTPGQPGSPAVVITRLLRHSTPGTDWHYFEAEKRYPGVGVALFASGWLATAGSSSYVTELKAGLGSANDFANTDVIAVIPGEPFQGATWVMALHSDLDLIYTLVQVGQRPDGGDDRSWRNILDVWANHCIP